MNKYGLFIVYKNKLQHEMKFSHDVDLEPIKMLMLAKQYNHLNVIAKNLTEEAAFIDWNEVVLARCWKVE